MDGRRKRSFIKEVKKYPILWRTTSEAPPLQKELKWLKVANRFEMTVEEVQIEWKRLLQSRRAAHWRRTNTPQEKKWKYEDDMSFLDKGISRNKTLEPIVPLMRLVNNEDTGAGTRGKNWAVTSGYNSASTSGDNSASTSGGNSASTSGDNSASTSGDNSASTSGGNSASTSGDNSASTSGDTSASTSGEIGVGSWGGIVVKKELNKDVDAIIIIDDDFDDVEAEMMNIINKKLNLLRAVRDSLRTSQEKFDFVRGLDPMLSDAICQYFRKFC